VTEAAKVAELAQACARHPQTITIEHDGIKAQVLLVPNDSNGGYHQHSVKALLEPYRAAPERRKGTAQLTDLNSFIAHTNRFKDEDSLVFLDRKAPSLTAVLDYHRKGAAGAPRFGCHRGQYTFPLSDEWHAWSGQNAKPMDQEKFARWVEDHLVDVADPANAGDGAKAFVQLLGCTLATPAKLLELSHGLDLHVGQRVKQHARLATGEVTFQFMEEHADADGKPLKVPGAFLLGIRVFRGGDAYQLPVRLRYRVQQGTISWHYELHQAARILDHALAEACADVVERCQLDVLDGVPE
jgi:uncharacterized protein YfdQ (DUF2303 family)